jgi:tRNA1(Val) A37 N6-methylase TrmN6
VLPKELERLIRKHFDETNPDKKKEYKNRIDELISQITNGHKEFDFEVYFSEVFHENKGFDVVIGNPPYGFRDVLTKIEKEYFRKVEKIEFSSGDSAELFCKKSFDKLVKVDGILTFIIPQKSLYGDSWHGFRKNYWQTYNLIFLLDSSKAFQDVLLEANAFGLSKSP